ncbi:hypothetical protein JOC62_000145 [Clostridium sardiniense]|nr:hypothetical protein [Clostridium sardiniense]
MVDYLIPQIYWQFNQPAAPYGELVDWWNEQFEGVEETQLYIGHPNYKIIENSAKDFDNPDEIPSQLRFNQKYDNVKGSAFFSYNKLDGRSHIKLMSSYDLIGARFNLDNIVENINTVNRDDINKKTTETIQEYYKTYAKTPAKPWLDHEKTSAVNGLNGRNKNEEITLRWNDKNSDTRFYQIYRVEGRGKNIDRNDAKNVIARFGIDNGTQFTDNTADSKKTYTYGVTIVDKAGNESDINTFTVKGKK